MYALELQSYKTGCKTRIGTPIGTYERVAKLARSVSNESFWKQSYILTPKEKQMAGQPFIVGVAGGWLRVVRV